MSPPRLENPAHPLSPLHSLSVPAPGHRHCREVMSELILQFFIVLLVILLAELILLILFFVYMDKVNLHRGAAGRSQPGGWSRPAETLASRRCRGVCRRPEGPAPATSSPHLETLCRQLTWYGLGRKASGLVPANLWCCP